LPSQVCMTFGNLCSHYVYLDSKFLFCEVDSLFWSYVYDLVAIKLLEFICCWWEIKLLKGKETYFVCSCNMGKSSLPEMYIPAVLELLPQTLGIHFRQTFKCPCYTYNYYAKLKADSLDSSTTIMNHTSGS